MKKIKLSLLIVLIMQSGLLIATQHDTLRLKQHFYDAKAEIENMLNGKDSLDFERAVFITENAYWGNLVNYRLYQTLIDFHTYNIFTLAEVHRNNNIVKKPMLHESKEDKQEDYNKLLYNWAIYTYFSDTNCFSYNTNTKKFVFQHFPFKYPSLDPFATDNWQQSQVLSLLINLKGNCNAQVNLFKIFADRFNTGAKVNTAPGHIYITHEDLEDRTYNLELGSNRYTGAGTILTLTYTPVEAVKSGIALRALDQKQNIALNLVYLAKGYENRFNTKTDPFIYECAVKVLEYDTNNLNAMLLKAEYLEGKIINKNKSVKELQKDKDFIEYEELITKLYDKSYREMPLDMKNILISGLRDEVIGMIYKDHTPKAFTNPDLQEGTRYATLSSGLFDEMHFFKPVEKYGRTLFDAKNKKIKAFTKADTLYNNYNFDPVVSAWQIDPLAHEFPYMSPYAAFEGNPIYYTDPDGRAVKPVNKDAEKVVHGSLESTFGDDYSTVLDLTTSDDGVISSGLVNHYANATPYTKSAFKKHLKDNGIKFDKDKLNDAYNLYNTIATNDLYEVAVFHASSPDNTYSTGDDGTIVQGSNGTSTNKGLSQFEYKFEENDSQETIDKEINSSDIKGEGWGLIKYEPHNGAERNSNHQGTILIDGKNQRVSQGSQTFKESSKVVNPTN